MKMRKTKDLVHGLNIFESQAEINLNGQYTLNAWSGSRDQ